MRVYTTIMMCLMLYGLNGCNQTVPPEIDQIGDVELVGVVNNIAVENAIIAQHTLYPFHFEPDGAKLNELGLSDLDVLIRHFREHPGTLNIHRGESADDIYAARLSHVIDKMREGGIEPDRVVIQDGMPGGPGMASDQVVEVLKKAGTPLQDNGWGTTQSR